MINLEPLNNSQIRNFKAAAQHLEPMLKIGKAGLSDGFIASINEALEQHQLVKIKFVELKDQKKELAPELAEKTSSHLIIARRECDGVAPGEATRNRITRNPPQSFRETSIKQIPFNGARLS
jgi:RNA-binding protein